MRQVRILNRTSVAFFLLGFIADKLRFVPVALVSTIANLAALFFNFLGYLAWFAASKLYPEHPKLKQVKFGLNQFKTQNKISALLGGIAIITAAIALALPVLLIPTAWLFALSSVVWVYSEYNKKQHPFPGDKEFSSKRQSLFLRFALALTTLSVLTAVAATLSFVFPMAAPIVLTISAIATIYMIAIIFYFWVDFTFYKFKLNPVINDQSYKQMMAKDLTPGNHKTIKHDLKAALVDKTEEVSVNLPTPLDVSFVATDEESVCNTI